jgi:hypothetical protein
MRSDGGFVPEVLELLAREPELLDSTALHLRRGWDEASAGVRWHEDSLAESPSAPNSELKHVVETA